MLLRRWDEFVALNLDLLRPNSIQSLTNHLAQYLVRLTTARQLNRYTRTLGIESQMREFRRGLDHNPRHSSMLWRACWATLLGLEQRRICRRYGIESEETEWLLSALTTQQIESLELMVQKPWIQKPNHAAIQEAVLSTKPYCRDFVARKMTFLVRYDLGISAEDLEHEMLAAGLSAAYRSDGRTRDVVHLRNIAWRSAKNYAISHIKHHTTQSRQRIVRIRKTLEANGPIHHYQRTHCRVCGEPSEQAVCGGCTVRLVRTPGSKLVREKPKRFMRRSANVTLVEGAPQTQDQFRSTVSSIDSPLRTTETDQAVTLLDRLSAPTYATDMADLVHDLRKQPIAIQLVCGAVLGNPEERFDQWLRLRYGDKGQNMQPKRYAHAACEFYGISPEQLRSQVLPILDPTYADSQS